MVANKPSLTVALLPRGTNYECLSARAILFAIGTNIFPIRFSLRPGLQHDHRRSAKR